MPFRPCPSGCGRFLSAYDGHDRCLQCLGRQHAEVAFVDDSCVCCGRMSMISLRSRLSFMKGLAPSAATHADLSGSSRGSPADALGDLRVTVRASPPGTPPRTSYSSCSEHPVRFPGDFAGPSHGAPSISFGRLLSRFDPSATQTVSTVRVRRSGMAVQGPPLRALPVSPCVHEGCRGRPYPVTGSGRQDPQLPRRLAYSSPIQRAVGRSQGLGAPAPQPVGASGQLGKEQALPCADNLFSRCGVRLGEYDGTPHGGTCPSSAELPEFLQRQECGTTETVSEAPGAYGIRSCSHAARIASYETTSALATLPGPEVGMAPRYTASRYLPAVSPLPQPLDRPCLSTGRGAPRTSVPAYCCHNRCLQHRLGRYMQRAGSLGALDRAPTALAHQLPGAVGSAFSLAAVPATAYFLS